MNFYMQSNPREDIMDQQNLTLAGERKFERLGWRSIELIVKYMASHVEGHLNSRMNTSNMPICKAALHIIPIARGGLIPATMLSHELGIPIRHVLNVKTYTDKKRNASGVYAEDMLNLGREEIAGAVFIDDIIDTGTTIEFINATYPDAVFAALIGKPKGMDRVGHKGLDVLTHLPIIKVPDDTWVEFPWERIIL